MKVSELQEGDVLFTKMSDRAPATHSQIFAGDSHFVSTIVHAVNDSDLKGPQQLMATGLRTADILVYRCRRGMLAHGAYESALKWVKYLVPYDQERKTVKEAYTGKLMRGDITSTIKVALHMKLLFQEHGIFRAIKYTARRDEILCYPSDGESQRGLTCTMFVILCYQAAALADYVKTTGEVSRNDPKGRVSDKKMSVDELRTLEEMARPPRPRLDMADVKAYQQYVGLLQSGNEYKIQWNTDDEWRPAPTRKPNPPLPGYNYIPSILCWKGTQSITGFDFASAMTAGMMVDAKITTSEQLRLCMDADAVGWENKGFLDKTESNPFDPSYKVKRTDFQQWAEQSRDKFKPVL